MITPEKDYTLGKVAFILFTLEELKWVLVYIAITLLVSIFRDATRSAFLVRATHVLDIVAWLAVILGLLWSWWKFRNTTFSLQEFDLKMKSGVIQKREISIPYRHIQSVDILRGPIHQIMGLSKIVMLTAGHEEPNEKGLTEVVLEPIDRAFAEDIRNALQERIGVQVVRDEAAAAPVIQ